MEEGILNMMPNISVPTNLTEVTETLGFWSKILTGDENETRAEELANAITHGVGILFSLCAATLLIIWLIKNKHSWYHFYGSIVFVGSMVLVYSFSTLYHIVGVLYWENMPLRTSFQKYDHIAIYFLIAGTYTPLMFACMERGVATPVTRGLSLISSPRTQSKARKLKNSKKNIANNHGNNTTTHRSIAATAKRNHIENNQRHHMTVNSHEHQTQHHDEKAHAETRIILERAWYWAVGMLILVWLFAFFGIWLKATYGADQISPLFSNGFYLAMGFLGAFGARPLRKSLGKRTVWWVIWGGISYSSGVAWLTFGVLPFNHAVWHCHVIGGSVCHYIAIVVNALPLESYYYNNLRASFTSILKSHRILHFDA